MNHGVPGDDHYGIDRLIDEDIAGVGLDNQQIETLLNDLWYQLSRGHAVSYIINTGQRFEFSRQTVYTAVMYVDRILADRILPSGLGVRILAVACLSLSAELNEIMCNNVPQLSEYPTGSDNINVNVISRMRDLVLNEFDGDMNIVTPFAFMNFFLSRFCTPLSRTEITRIITGELLTSVLTEVRIMINYRPSEIAAAATLAAVRGRVRRVILVMLINAIHESLDSDLVYLLYKSLRRLNYNRR